MRPPPQTIDGGAGASAVARCPRQRGLASTTCTLPIRRSVKPASQKLRYSRHSRWKRSS